MIVVYILLAVWAIWFAVALYFAAQIAPEAHEDDLGWAVMFAAFWPIAMVVLFKWQKEQPESKKD